MGFGAKLLLCSTRDVIGHLPLDPGVAKFAHTQGDGQTQPRLLTHLMSRQVACFREHDKEYRCRLLGISYTPSISTSALSLLPSSTSSLSQQSVSQPSQVPEWFDDSPLEDMHLDASRWRHQDHYAVLGLSRLRHEATSEHIKLAYRRRILSYHPDKSTSSASRNGSVSSKVDILGLLESGESVADNLFKCVQRAWETLSDKDKRQQWDSVDPAFDASIPREQSLSESAFFTVYEPVFARNGRFSVDPTVPSLGDVSSLRTHVEAFYDFWRRFESWRRFEWLDDDETAGTDAAGETRADKRWTEKKNKAARQRRKAEDNARIARLVEQAYKTDPRIVAFRAADRAEKEARRRQREETKDEQLQKEAAVKRQTDEERCRREALEREAQATAKQAREQERNALRKERKAFRDFWTSVSFYAAAHGAKDGKVDLKLMDERSRKVESLAQRLSAIQLAELNVKLQAGCIPSAAIDMLDQAQLSVAVDDTTSVQTALSAREEASRSDTPSSPAAPQQAWSLAEIDALIKAVKLFPPGTVDRWSRITAHLDKHGSSRSVDDVIREAANLKDGTSAAITAPLEQHQTTLAKGKRDPRIDANAPTVRANSDAPLPWTVEEQAALEQALKAISQETEERWERIAEMVGTRGKKECMARVRDIALALKAKRHTSKK